MNAIPQELKGRSMPVNRGRNRTKVVQMFGRRHAQSRKGLDVRIAMMQGVNVLVQAPQMDKSMSKKKVHFSKEWDQNNTGPKVGNILPGCQNFMVRLVSNSSCCVKVHHDHFPSRPLPTSQ